MFLISLHVFGHSKYITLGPDNEQHKQNSHPGIKVKWNSLQKQAKAIQLAALWQRGAYSRCPAGHWRQNTYRSCCSINDIGQLGSGNLEPICNRAHNSTNCKTIEIVINKNNHTQQSSQQHGTAASANITGCPFTIGSGCTGAGNSRHQNTQNNQENQNIDISPYLVCHNLKQGHNCIQHIEICVQQGSGKNTDKQ